MAGQAENLQIKDVLLPIAIGTVKPTGVTIGGAPADRYVWCELALKRVDVRTAARLTDWVAPVGSMPFGRRRDSRDRGGRPY